MSRAPNNPYAFPGERYEANEHITYQEGMTLRDWFAGQVLSGHPQTTLFNDPPAMARQCYAIADAMLAQRGDRP